MLGFLASKGVISISIYPRCSMYGIFTYIYPQNYPNVNNRPYIEHLGIYIYSLFSFFVEGGLCSGGVDWRVFGFQP